MFGVTFLFCARAPEWDSELQLLVDEIQGEVLSFLLGVGEGSIGGGHVVNEERNCAVEC